MLLPATLGSLLSRRNFLLQLFKPVQHDVDSRRRQLLLLVGLEHQEALAVRRHVVVREHFRRQLVQFFKEQTGLARSEAWQSFCFCYGPRYGNDGLRNPQNLDVVRACSS